jgi:hypothetical protein
MSFPVDLGRRLLGALRRVGLRVPRLRRSETATSNPLPPPIVEDALEALHLIQGGEQAAFDCPLNQWVHYDGFGLADGAWHPLRETLREYRRGERTTYRGSILERYYATWNPQNAREAFAGFDHAPELFGELPPACLFLSPWVAWSPQQTVRHVAHWIRKGWLQDGLDHFDLDRDGANDYGPVSDRHGEFEYSRLAALYESLDRQGFQRSYGDIRVMILKHDGDYRFIARGGKHRAVAMSALGYATAPATLDPPWLIDTGYAKFWPQVRRGVWTRSEALAYVEYLFEWDSRSWAANLGFQTDRDAGTYR